MKTGNLFQGLTLPDNKLFAFAGMWSEWVDQSTGEIVHTYTILTTEANEMLSEIHNSKKRMPIIVSTKDEQNWLQGQALKLENDQLIANKV